MPDQPEVTDGTRQPSHRIATRFDLNDAFVTQVGQEKAEQFRSVLEDVADTHGHASRVEIEAELRSRLAAIGVEPTDVELDSYADQINRSSQTMEDDEPHPYDPELPDR